MPAQLTLKVQSHTLLVLSKYDGNITMFTKEKYHLILYKTKKITVTK